MLVLDELFDRLERAEDKLGYLQSQATGVVEETRLAGKREGVNLAKSYVEEALRMSK